MSTMISLPIPNWLLITGTVLLAFYLYATRTYNFFKKRNLPFRKPIPLLGNTKSIVFRTQPRGEFLMATYNSMKGHRVAGLFEFRKPIFMLRDPELIKLVCVKEFDHFMNRHTLVNEKADPLFSKSLLLLKDNHWKAMRTTLSPAYTSSKMKGLFLVISECAQQAKNYLEQQCREQPGGPDVVLSIEMRDFFTRLANDVIASSAFGVKCDSLKHPNNEFYKIGKNITNMSWIRSLLLFLSLSMPKLGELLGITYFSKEAERFLISLVRDAISLREHEDIVRPDMIHLLKEASKLAEQDPDKVKLNENDIAAQAVVFFYAGFESVTSLICFTTYLLAVHPDVQNRLLQEIDSELEKEGGLLSYEMVKGMKYLDMVVSETLRLYPPFTSMDRVCVKPLTVPGTNTQPPVTFQKGDTIWLPIVALHHDPKYFPEPEKFDPERFSEERKNTIEPFTYLPFGVGPRVCIAQRFALMEVKVALVIFLSNFTLHVVDKTPIPMRLCSKSFTNSSADGFWCGVKLRNKMK